MARDATIALTDVADVLSYFGEAPTTNAFWVYYTDSASTATVQILNDYLILIHDAAEDANLNLNADAYDTIGELVAYINSDVSGWTAGRICHSSEDSDDLLETGQLNALGESNKETLKIVPEYFIAELINRASDFINRYCNRKFVSQTYTNEIYLGNGRTELILDQYPVTEVARVIEGRANSFSIKNTSTDANFCTVEVTATELQLVVDGGDNEETGSDEFTLATYTYIDELIAAIHDNGGGWECTTLATDTDTRDASELLIRPCMNVNATSQAYLETGNNELTNYLLRKPRNEDRNEGILYYPSIFTEGVEYFLTYTAGWTTIPYSLESACIELVKFKYDQGKQASAGLKKETIGSVYSYEKFSLADLRNGLPPDLMAELDFFKKRFI